MKKKMLFMAALAGAVTLGSCVKDDVSSSVEAVRNAKANELNALANEHNANAAHRAASSAADIALTQAQTAHENALAAVQQANADAANLQNELDKAAFAEALEALKAQYAYTVADNKEAAQAKMNTLLNADMVALDAAEYTRVAALIARFQTAYNNWVDAQQELVDKKVALETAKIDAVHAQKVIEKNVAAAEETLEVAKAVLEAIKEQGQIGQTTAEVLAKIEALKVANDALRVQYQNSAELPAFVKASNAIFDPYVAFLKAKDKITKDLAAIPTLFETSKEKDGGVESVWVNPFNSTQTGAYYSYEVLGATKSAGKDTKLNSYTNPIDKKSYTSIPNASAIFNTYKAADKDAMDKITKSFTADSTAAWNKYYADPAIDAIGTPDDKATTKQSDGVTPTEYAKLAALKATLEDAETDLKKENRNLGDEREVLAAAIKAKNATAQATAESNIDLILTNIYGAVSSTPSGMTATEISAWKASDASIAKRPNDKAGYLAFDATKAKKDVEKQEEVIATAKEAPAAKAAAETRDKALKKVEDNKKIVAGAADDLKAFNDAAKAFTDAENAYNKAAKALMDVNNEPLKKNNADIAALEAIYTETYEKALADQEEKVANAELALAKAKNVAATKNPDLIISEAEQDVEKAEMKVVTTYALLEAARKAIENSGIEYEIESKDEPAPAPAEDETPAEGEGESEGEGEEA